MTWGQAEPAWQMQVEVMELPYLMRTRLNELPIEHGYLELPVKVVAKAARAMGEKRLPRVGACVGRGRLERIPVGAVSLAARLLKVPGIEFWNLQGGASAGEGKGTMRDAAEVCGVGQLPLAATIVNLDLVITVDTLSAHLAGALGKPAWVMLHYAADWRWMAEREDSPWYPSLRLFRQSTPAIGREPWGGCERRLRASCADSLEAWTLEHTPPGTATMRTSSTLMAPCSTARTRCTTTRSARRWERWQGGH